MINHKKIQIITFTDDSFKMYKSSILTDILAGITEQDSCTDATAKLWKGE